MTSYEGRGSTFTVAIEAEPLEEAKQEMADRREAPDTVIIARAEGSPTAAALEAYAADHGWRPVAARADELTPYDFERARAIFADAAALSAIATHLPDVLRPDRKMVVVKLSGFGEGLQVADLSTVDLALEVPIAHADVVACMNVIGFDRSFIAAARTRASDAGAHRTEDIPSFAGCSVLVADDSPVNRELLAAALARLQIDVTCVEDGVCAVEAVMADEFDCVLLDGSMPVMDGFAAATHIRDWERNNARTPLPIIAVTAHIIGSKADEWRQFGMTDCLIKPFTLASLERCIARHVHPRSASERPSPDAMPRSAEALSTPPAHRSQACADEAARLPLIDEDAIAAMRQVQQPGDDLAARMAAIYEAHAQRALARLRQLDPLTCDRKTFAEAAHALKSLSLSIGGARVAAISNALEQSALRDEMTEASDHLDRLEAAIPDTISALAAVAAGDPKPKPRPQAMSA